MTDTEPANDPRASAQPLLHWVSAGGGRLALTHRPGLRGLPDLRAEGCSRLVTLLVGREGAERIGTLAREAGLEWTWLPLDSGRPPTGERVWREIERGLATLAEQLSAGESLALHCSAGIHRTGMIAYALLRVVGATPEQALDAIERMRPVTRAGLTPAHLRFGDAIATQMLHRAE